MIFWFVKYNSLLHHRLELKSYSKRTLLRPMSTPASALINIDDKKLQLDIYKQIISSKLSVRQTENIVRGKKISNVSNSSSDVSKIYIDATNKFENFFDSKVTLKENSEGKVSLSTTFKSINDLYSIIKKLSN